MSTQWNRDLHYHLTTSLTYLVLKVDCRGTGFRGRSHRTPVRDRLGQLEAEDVIDVARTYTTLGWVDATRVGVWGWVSLARREMGNEGGGADVLDGGGGWGVQSYGGFLTAKIVEQDAGVFTTAMAVAPVTDWRYYDSICQSPRFPSLSQACFAPQDVG